jgi:uncharacterized repeat protein (TIGR01451 family)
VGIGQNLTYTLAVHNGGDGQATNVVVTATLPSGADFVSASVGCSRAGNTATCNVGQLAKGSNASVNIVVKPTAKGTLNFSAGVTSDVTDPDSSNNSAAATTEVSATGTQVKPGDIIISEFRSQGPGTPSAQSSSNAPEAFPGANDDFVELYNNTDAAVTVGPADASGGWALVVREPGNENAPVLLATIPTGTVIPARGHFLIASDAYTLGQIAQGDLVIPGNLLDGGGIALFRTADPSKFTSTADRLDAVGFSSVADTMYRESSGLAPIGQAQAQLSFVRKLNNETPQDTDDNAADFQLLTPDGAAIGGVQSVLGAPGPENLAAPPVRNGMLTPGLIAPNVAASSAPNRVRSTAPYSYTDPVTGQTTNFTLGTLSVRRTYTNNTGVNVTRLRFRIIDMTTGPAPAGVSDLRAISSTPQVVTVNSSNITLQGTVLDALPNQAEGGGINSTLSCCSTTGGTVIGERTVSLSQPLAPGQTIALQWLLGVKQIGSFRFYMNIEALP